MTNVVDRHLGDEKRSRGRLPPAFAALTIPELCLTLRRGGHRHTRKSAVSYASARSSSYE